FLSAAYILSGQPGLQTRCKPHLLKTFRGNLKVEKSRIFCLVIKPEISHTVYDWFAVYVFDSLKHMRMPSDHNICPRIQKFFALFGLIGSILVLILRPPMYICDQIITLF